MLKRDQQNIHFTVRLNTARTLFVEPSVSRSLLILKQRHIAIHLRTNSEFRSIFLAGEDVQRRTPMNRSGYNLTNSDFRYTLVAGYLAALSNSEKNHGGRRAHFEQTNNSFRYHGDGSFGRATTAVYQRFHIDAFQRASYIRSIV